MTLISSAPICESHILNQPLMNKSDTKISSLPSHLLLPATNLSSPFTAAVKEREISAKLQQVYVRVFFCKCSLGKNCFCWERNCEKHLCYCLGGNLKLLGGDPPSLKALKKKTLVYVMLQMWFHMKWATPNTL